MRDKILYEETYRGKGLEVKKDSLPTLNHLSEDFECVEAFLKKAGAVERDGKRLEYNDIRVYLKEKS